MRVDENSPRPISESGQRRGRITGIRLWLSPRFDKAVVQVFERLVYRSDSNISLIRISTHLIKAAENLRMIVRSIEHHGI